MQDISGKTAIVTGAASGIGLGIATALAAAGANVAMADIQKETVEQAAHALSGTNKRVMPVRIDVTQEQSVLDALAEAERNFGKLHIACNNAGIGGELNPVAEMSGDGWRKVIDINLSGVFYAMRAQIPRMLEAGGGSIVNMASVLGQVGTARSSAYVAAKHGVVGLTQTAAIEYASRGVRVNAVGPGYIDTPLLDDLPAEARNALVGLHPIGRLGRAEEVAELVAWLSSDRASFVTGAYYPIDGAYLAR